VLTTQHRPSVKVGTNFADKRRSLYSIVRSRTEGHRDLVEGKSSLVHMSQKKKKLVINLCPKWRLGKVIVKGVIVKGIANAKSSYVYKSSNTFEKCLMRFAGKRRM
jgi:hypothetical protein